MIAILHFLGKTLDLFVTQIGLERGFVELNPSAQRLTQDPYLASLVNMVLSLAIYGIYEYYKSSKLIRDIVYFVIASNFIIAFYGIGVILFLE